MLFTLEVLQANHGDCLLLHFGDKDAPSIILIDGGPGFRGSIYSTILRPRLIEIKNALSPSEPLPLSMVMISHMDDDHVGGILRLTNEVISDKESGDSPLVELGDFWFNTFDDIVGNIEIPSIASIGTSAEVADLGSISPDFSDMDEHLSAVIASTGQGRRLRDDMTRLSSTVNSPFEAPSTGGTPLVRSDQGNAAINWGSDLNITVIHPNQERLEEMQEKWDKDLKKAAERGDNSIILASVGGRRDTSAFNLASIVCLLEFQGKTILLTGDARDDDILQGLMKENLLDDEGKIHVDILKVPHHGSDRNVSEAFFQKVTADHYVISGDGHHGNPDKATLVMLEEGTLGRDDFTIHLTNHEGEEDLQRKLDEFVADAQNHGRSFRVNFREEGAHSIVLNLLEEVDY